MSNKTVQTLELISTVIIEDVLKSNKKMTRQLQEQSKQELFRNCSQSILQCNNWDNIRLSFFIKL